MKFTAIAALFSAVVSTVVAQQPAGPATAGIAFSAPLTGSQFEAGKPNAITWTVQNPQAPPIDVIELRRGNPANLQVVTANILTGPVNVDKGGYTWNIPANTETGVDYALMAKNSANPAAASYAGPFTILGAPPGTVNNTNTGSTQPTGATGTGATAATTGTSPSGSKGSASSGTQTPSSTPTNAANGLKAGMIGVAGAVGAAVLLF
ncbi:hypothetical protein EC973_004794 [Apophysomyces ossiformis]|uniref:Yeast cell wall synthesis Kre9/Knh1-like N-terminal domain-containing protein n=1 Tax=Apophysomyces ossiformis TaxID=679940 RepID=A0A8H7BPV1_9FUNG|nr:hypothetical protein EC973_004794 [Apophysomyces ossiformis]